MLLVTLHKPTYVLNLLLCIIKNYNGVVYLVEGLAVGVGFGAIGKSPSATFESARYGRKLWFCLHNVWRKCIIMFCVICVVCISP